MPRTFEDLLTLAQEKRSKKISVAVAQDVDVLLAIKKAVEMRIIEPILIGNKEEIVEMSNEIDFDITNIKILHEEDKIMACRVATKLVSNGQANILMKGLVGTSTIMKQVLDKDIGLRTDKLMSHAAVFHVKTYHKLLFLTDAAMNINPNLNQKKEIIENAVKLAHSLDIENPKVAVIAAKEKVSPKMDATIHGKKLSGMNKNGEIIGCIVEGPFALDNAISKKAAIHKGINSRIAGDVDILLVPNIEAGNVLYKSLTFFARSKSAGIILGANAPIVLTSRTDNEEAKLNSIVLGVLMA